MHDNPYRAEAEDGLSAPPNRWKTWERRLSIAVVIALALTFPIWWPVLVEIVAMIGDLG